MRLTRSMSSTRRVRRAVADVLGDGAVEQEVVLQHDAEVAPVLGQPQRQQVAAVDAHAALRRPVERHDQADERALARPGRSDERRRRAGRRAERHVLQHRRAGVVLEPDVLELDVAAHVVDRHRAVRVLGVLARRVEDLANAIEPGEGLA